MLLVYKHLLDWKEGVEKEKESFSTRIFYYVEKGDMTKMEAITLLTKYELLPINDWALVPEFAEDDDYFDKYSTIHYVDLLCKENFGKDNEKTGWVRFPETTLEEAIDQVWDIVKDEKVIGCCYDW